MITAIIMYMLSLALSNFDVALNEIVFSDEAKMKFACAIVLFCSTIVAAFYIYYSEIEPFERYKNIELPSKVASGTLIANGICMFIMVCFNANDKHILIAFSIITLISLFIFIGIFRMYVVKYKYNKFVLFSRFIHCELQGIISSALIFVVIYIQIAAIIFIAAILIWWALKVVEDFFE